MSSRSVLRRPMLAAVLGFTLAACAASDVMAPVNIADAGCVGERADFTAAAALLPAGEPRLAVEAYWNGLTTGGAGPAATAPAIRTEATALDGAIERLNSTYGTLRACRLDQADQIRAGLVQGTLTQVRANRRLGMERKLVDTELAAAEGANVQLAQRAIVLKAAADRLAGAVPGTDLKVAKAASAPPAPAPAYVATATTVIRAKPDASGARIADLRRGTRVQAHGEGAVAGWMPLALNDGSVGYVAADNLRPAQPNASAVKAAAQAEKLRAIGADPVVAAVLATRRTVPDRLHILAALLESTGEVARVAFNPGQAPAPPPGSPEAVSQIAPPVEPAKQVATGLP